MRMVGKFLLLATSVFSLASCATPTKLASEQMKVSEQIVVSKDNVVVNTVDIIGKVAFRCYETKSTTLDDNEDLNPIKETLSSYVYPYENIVIKESKIFEIDIPSSLYNTCYADLIDICGDSHLEVMFGGVRLFNNDSLDYIDEDYVAIRGSKGIFSSLANSSKTIFSAKDEVVGSLTFYSSHKVISEKGIEKIFSAPYYGVKIDSDICQFNFSKNKINIVNEGDYIKENALMPVGEIKILPGSRTYNIVDIVSEIFQ